MVPNTQADKELKLQLGRRRDCSRFGCMNSISTNSRKKTVIPLQSKRSSKGSLNSTILKLDIDTHDREALRANTVAIKWTLDTLGYKVLAVKTHITKRGVHRLVQIKAHLQPLEIVMLQALCGSDLRRETFNLVRALRLPDAPAFWHTRWNVLYSEKLTGGKEE
jgi:hypothetical protein